MVLTLHMSNLMLSAHHDNITYHLPIPYIISNTVISHTDWEK